MSSFFTGLSEYLQQSTPTGDLDKLQQYKTFPGHVLAVCMGEGSPMYETGRDIGKIKFRDLAREYNKDEDLCTKVAYPLDRSIARYPYPGEEVIIYRAFGEVTSPNALTLSNIFYYTFVVSTHHNVTYNQNPFIGTDSLHVNSANPFISYDVAKRRFEKVTKDLNSVRDGANKTKIYKQLRPQEGDFVLQGRFGQSIRMGSTSAVDTNNEWNGDGKPGVAGDGIMVLRVDRDNTITEKDMYTSGLADTDDAAIYLCTSQNIPLLLACTKEMKSWGASYGLVDNAADQVGGALTTNQDTSQLWQKVVDSTKPIDTVYQSVGGSSQQVIQPNQAPTTNL